MADNENIRHEEEDESRSSDVRRPVIRLLGKSDGRSSFGRRRVCRFCADTEEKIDYKNIQTLRSFITDRGKLLPRRISGTCAKHQRAVAVAVRRARMIALVPFTVTGK
jgi:small subunit ribosomal protein S18